MSIQLALQHITHYRYEHPILLAPQIIRLRPSSHCPSTIEAYSLTVSPKNKHVNWKQDPYGNHIAQLIVNEKISELKVTVDLIASIEPQNPFDFYLDQSVSTFPFQYTEAEASDLQAFFTIKESGKLLNQLKETVNSDSQQTIEFLVNLNNIVTKTIRYNAREEAGIQDCETTLELGSGSCRDMAWLLCQLLRHYGLAARFASGYLIQLKSTPDPLADDKPIDEDMVELHAWSEVYIPGAGWIGLDPTSGLLTNECHIPLCCSAEPANTAPISGLLGSCKAEMNVEMLVARIKSSTKDMETPYPQEQWLSINKLGEKIDGEVNELDVRLTLGGEPTYVPLDKTHELQWSTGALGKEKFNLAQTLLQKLSSKFAPGPLLQQTLGKSYPRESCPRWSLQCCWRVDGEHIWNNQELLTHKSQPSSRTLEDARKLLTLISRYLGVNTQHIKPAHEDCFFDYWHSKKSVPDDDGNNVSSLANNIAELTKITENNLTGYVLPLHWSAKLETWVTSDWKLKHEMIILKPGDSSLGYRLPLDELPQNHNGDYEANPEVSLLVEPKKLRTKEEYIACSQQRSHAKAPLDSVDYTIPTALCTEIINGELSVFIPPISDLDCFLELLSAIELATAELDFNITIQGSPAPADLRLKRFNITPDPGVIEVNIHPANSWKESSANLKVCADEAAKIGLGSKKFMFDGRLIGTGGGNHLTLGGKTPADSPFLRRPDLLQSMLTYWQHHPSLSYLFSGLFIGPTSQAPRVDEARHESLYELEIAFAQLQQEQQAGPWVIDRVLRHLLVDISGNEHRSEFCIDKLYSPKMESGRQGLLELRAFEMTPHWQMNALSQLLVEALIVQFWRAPYQKQLIRWGTELHDRFMLGHFIWQDLQEVIDFLNQRGHEFDINWFKPHFEFRFPEYGEVNIDGVNIKLRKALEPWPALGDEALMQGSSRSVDSAMERCEIKVRGLTKDKYILCCNGIKIPLHNTGRVGEYVAGIRFKAWLLTETLHPTAEVNAPLMIDLVDTTNQRSIGGCTYHVNHPGGLQYEANPINQREADARIHSRFQAFGHTPGRIENIRENISPECPYTLDLRKFASS